MSDVTDLQWIFFTTETPYRLISRLNCWQTDRYFHELIDRQLHWQMDRVTNWWLCHWRSGCLSNRPTGCPENNWTNKPAYWQMYWLTNRLTLWLIESLAEWAHVWLLTPEYRILPSFLPDRQTDRQTDRQLFGKCVLLWDASVAHHYHYIASPTRGCELLSETTLLSPNTHRS